MLKCLKGLFRRRPPVNIMNRSLPVAALAQNVDEMPKIVAEMSTSGYPAVAPVESLFEGDVESRPEPASRNPIEVKRVQEEVSVRENNVVQQPDTLPGLLSADAPLGVLSRAQRPLVNVNFPYVDTIGPVVAPSATNLSSPSDLRGAKYLSEWDASIAASSLRGVSPADSLASTVTNGSSDSPVISTYSAYGTGIPISPFISLQQSQENNVEQPQENRTILFMMQQENRRAREAMAVRPVRVASNVSFSLSA